MGRVLAVGVGALLALAAPAAAAPISEAPSLTGNPQQIGGPATARPLSLAEAPRPPRHPFMAPNDRSNIHDDAYQTDTADLPGPLGRAMRRVSTFYLKECASVTFDSRGRIVTICVGLDRPQLKLLDPDTLAELATMDLPPRQTAAGRRVQRLQRRRLLLPGRPRPGGDPHQRAPPAGRGPAGRRLRRAARLRPDRAAWPPATSSSRPCPTGRGGSGWCPPRGKVVTVDPGERPHARHRPALAGQQLVRRRRDRRRVHRGRRRAAPPGRRGRRHAAQDLEPDLPQLRDQEAGPDPGGLGHHAHAHGPPPRGHHRQRRPHERGDHASAAGASAARARCARSPCSARAAAPPTTR